MKPNLIEEAVGEDPQGNKPSDGEGSCGGL